MRVLSFLFLVSFIYTSCKASSANVKLDNMTEVRKALSKEWEVVYMENIGSRVKVPEEQVTNILFNKNGTYTSRVKNGVITQNGEWNYDSRSQILYMGMGKEKGPARVVKLTTNELILVQYLLLNDKIADSIVMTYKKL